MGRISYVLNRRNSKETKQMIETAKGVKNWIKKYKRQVPWYAWIIIAMLIFSNGYFIKNIFTGKTDQDRSLIVKVMSYLPIDR